MQSDDMTWGEFKAALELVGIQDNHKIHALETGLNPKELKVQTGRNHETGDVVFSVSRGAGWHEIPAVVCFHGIDFAISTIGDGFQLQPNYSKTSVDETYLELGLPLPEWPSPPEGLNL